MSQYIKYKDIQDKTDHGQKLYRCDVPGCGKIGLWSIVTITTWVDDIKKRTDYCDECYAQYTRDKLISQDYREASGGEKGMGD